MILADEPTGALDSANAAHVLEIFAGLGTPERAVVMVTHDPTVAGHGPAKGDRCATAGSWPTSAGWHEQDASDTASMWPGRASWPGRSGRFSSCSARSSAWLPWWAPSA